MATARVTTTDGRLTVDSTLTFGDVTVPVP